MNQEQVTSFVRIIVPVIAAWLAAKGVPGLGDPGIVAQIISIAIGVVALAWGFWAHTNTSKIISAAAVDPEVRIQIPPHVMAASPGIKDVVNDTSIPNVTSTH